MKILPWIRMIFLHRQFRDALAFGYRGTGGSPPELEVKSAFPLEEGYPNGGRPPYRELQPPIRQPKDRQVVAPPFLQYLQSMR
eukprot:scaffold8164_cov153-Skeletonema_dohrnii-CCMP3373.AAC.7